jgi:phosphoribosylaminoimidazole-succinocarboxamide synthase
MTQNDTYFLENSPLFSGKIRQVFNFSQDELLIKTSDKISAFDFVFDDEIDSKGLLLTKITKLWFKKTEHIIENHLLDDGHLVNLIPKSHKSCMLVKKCRPIRIESIVRGYISGSAYSQYIESGMVSDIPMKSGLRLNDKLETPIFTPSTKAEVGDKDENITFSQLKELIGNDKADYIYNKSIELYNYAHSYALSKGLCLIDTKFEFGYDNQNNIILIDEIFTPDCSRYCLAEDIHKKDVDFFDKQFFRNYLKEINWQETQIDIPDIIKNTIISRYQKVYNMLINA